MGAGRELAELIEPGQGLGHLLVSFPRQLGSVRLAAHIGRLHVSYLHQESDPQSASAGPLATATVSAPLT
jgi:hypothetical protein